MDEKEFFEKQVRDYYNQWMKKLNIKPSDRSFYEIYESLCSNIINNSFNFEQCEYSSDLFKEYVDGIFSQDHTLPILFMDGLEDLSRPLLKNMSINKKLRFATPSIINNSKEKLTSFIKSIDDYISIENESKKKENVEEHVEFFTKLNYPIITDLNSFNGTILSAKIYATNRLDSRFCMELTINKENLLEHFNKPSTPLFYDVETKLELPKSTDWVKTIGEKYLVEDKPLILEEAKVDFRDGPFANVSDEYARYYDEKIIPYNDGFPKPELGKKY
jgi:hypothetical protein